MNTHLKRLCLIVVIICSYTISSLAQNNIFLNKGIVQVKENTTLSICLDFINTSKARLNNDGQIYYLASFTNDGEYGFTSKKKTGTTHFLANNKIQSNNIISLNNVVFNNTKNTSDFDLKANIDIWGNVDLKKGIVKGDSTINKTTRLPIGVISFMPNSSHSNASDNSFVNGHIEKIGAESFLFPIGDSLFFRPLEISAPKNKKDAYQSKYTLDDKAFFVNHQKTQNTITVLNQREYWTLDKGIDNTKGDIILTLTWDERTTPKELLKDPEKELHIVRWDAKQKLWVDEAGMVDLAKKQITTLTNVKGYGFFTLATIKTDLILDQDVVIYNLVTPDGDGKNDYFIIDNINQYPNNTVEIYNRWAEKVYSSKNYDSIGNVFTGYSNSKTTINKNEKLPSGTYFYILNYEYKNTNGSRMIKKSGYLHLDHSK